MKMRSFYAVTALALNRIRHIGTDVGPSDVDQAAGKAVGKQKPHRCDRVEDEFSQIDGGVG